MQISDTVAIVTGGASGLGAACAREIAARGGRVVVLDMSDAGHDIAAEIGTAARFVKTDVTDEDQVQAAIDLAIAEFGTVTAAINCAGVVIGAKTVGRDGAHPLGDFSKVVDINLKGTFNVARLAATAMGQNTPNADGERGVIVNTASIAAFEGQKGQVAYAASKGGVYGMTLPMARDLGALGIRVNTMAPGLIMTPMLSSLPVEVQDQLANQPVFPKRLGQAAEIARLACFMIESPYLNGETIRLDAGARLP